MNVFLSWSGTRSKEVTELLDDWLQCVIQAVDPWMSSKDIDRGSLWFSEVNNQLQNTTIGIICLTHENINKPWILFEAGALAKGLSNNRVCTFLIDLEPTDVGTPLSQFNHTLPTQEGLWELVRTLNSSLKERALKENILSQVFETYWPAFERRFKEIILNTETTGPILKRNEDDILIEILSATRSMDRRVRNLEVKNRTVNGRSYPRGEQSKDDPFKMQKRIKELYEGNIHRDAIVEVMMQEEDIPFSMATGITDSVLSGLANKEFKRN